MKFIPTQLILSLSLILFSSAQQTIWYENSANIDIASFATASQGTYTENVANPDTSGINGRATVAQYTKTSLTSTSAYLRYDLPASEIITSTNGLSFTFQGYTNRYSTSTREIRFFLRNSSIGASSTISVNSNFTTANSWRQFTFDFSSLSIPAAVIAAGGYDQIMIGLGQGQTLTTQYYIDRIKRISNSTVDPNTPSAAEWMAGEWGVRLIVRGGSSLDTHAPTNDYVAGAQEIVDELPTCSHVITNFTNAAHGYYFCLRDNPYVDVATEIHPDFVPSLANEQIILDVINVLKNGGKKVILYLAADGPSALGGTPDNATYLAAWQNYYNGAPWNGDEYAAYKNLCKGYLERFAGLVDGYWLDHLTFFPGTNAELTDFISMIRTINPGIAIGSNIDKTYFDDGAVQVDTDSVIETVGLDDYEGVGDSIDSRDYDVIRMVANDQYMDYTPGHPTPLGNGAPASSWAYEEYTIKDMMLTPRDSFNGNRQVIKHLWIPMREKWTSANHPLVFDQETAHRFVHNIITAGASMTWSNTITGGKTTPADMAILKYVDEQIALNAAPVPYERPEGAFLVGETLTGFDAWSRSFAGNTDHARAGDLDGDGYANFVEYAFGGDLNVHNECLASTSMTLDAASGNNELSYARRKNTGLTYTVECSDTLDMNDWQPLTSTQFTTSLTTETEEISLAIPAPSPAAPQLFLRVSVME